MRLKKFEEQPVFVLLSLARLFGMITKDIRQIPEKADINVAFYTMGDARWSAGFIYLRNLLYAAQQINQAKIQPYILTSSKHQNIQDYLHFIGTHNIIPFNIPPRWTPLGVINGVSKRLLWRDLVMERILRKHKINALFNPTLAYRYPRIANLAWLPDFQHLHLPEMFNDTERFSRTRIFLRAAKLATRIILLSEAARKDFESFAPGYAYKAKVLQPISYVPPSLYNYDLNSILHLYHLPEKFIYLPNQFWKHKNHERAFQAVKILRENGVKVSIVCTGNSVDWRYPAYFTDLWQKLSQWNIQNQIIYLGLIPHEHVLLLMRQSICVLNPSLFEGWGITVDEARSVGKQVLLSEIPAHREQNPPRATFFDPYDPEDLAKKLAQIWLNSLPGPDLELELEARHSLPYRLHAYAEALISIVREAVKEIDG